MLYHIAKIVVFSVIRCFGKATVIHREKARYNGPFVLACNHVGWLDILWLGVMMYPTQIHFMAKKELFKYKWSAWLLRNLNAFPVDRENPGPSTLKIPAKLLKEGKVVGIFPSGTRTKEEVPLKKGVATIAERANVPIIPAAYAGPAKLHWKHFLFRRAEVKLIFGDPIFIEDASLSGAEKREKLLEMLNKELHRLKDEIES